MSSAATARADAVRVTVGITAVLFFHLASAALMASRVLRCCSRALSVRFSLSFESIVLTFVLAGREVSFR